MKAKIDPNTGQPSIEFGTVEDFKTIAHLWDKLFPPKTRFLKSKPSYLFEFYSDDKIKWLKSSDNEIKAPCEVIHDYRKNPISNWGTCVYKGDYAFPNKLSRVKELMVAKFSKAGKLSKGSGICPRVSNVSVQDNMLAIDIERASYYDQVATNLSLDFKHNEEIAESLGAKTIREWDIKQSKTKKGSIPSFTKSRLANTIGVAMAIVATNKRGQKVILIRKRTSDVAVFENTLTLPFSFVLNFEPHNMEPGQTDSILNLIKPDFRHEQAQELGLEPHEIDFANVKPILFCRELCRGGKPQFILEIEIKTLFVELASRIVEAPTLKPEYTSKLLGRSIENAKKLKQELSHDLLAYLVAKS